MFIGPDIFTHVYWASCDPITCLRDPQWLLHAIGPQWPIGIASKVQIKHMHDGPTCPSHTRQPIITYMISGPLLPSSLRLLGLPFIQVNINQVVKQGYSISVGFSGK